MNLAKSPTANNLKSNQSSNCLAHHFIYCFKPINLALFRRQKIYCIILESLWIRFLSDTSKPLI